ncbi:restriction endonuclease subunit S [Paraferrimonas haliotis]|uniref:Type I restriction-modification protein subunit S n=1 Tax=Paraferrimonas haliotis TaxID=2013866 RepID=A0AA37TLY7_9GAMM|nr:restriction endonuclease subunit S [Paraferrimonas haliotis]GLS83774.1 type I restriction-modification protein subunit S [Paraferrimonas haliotis]GLS83901.1 type I restriction-modification protein subunit S [Paraferrimonas haliotis]
MNVEKNVPVLRFNGFIGEWAQRPFGDCFDNIPNNTLSRADLNYEHGIAKNVHYGDVLIKFGEILDASDTSMPFVTDENVVSKQKHAALKNGDIVIADAAEDSTVGKCTELFNIDEQVILSGLHTIAVRPNLPFASKYLGYYLNSSSYHDQLLPLMQGTKVLSISKTTLKNTSVNFPSANGEQIQIGNYFQKLDNLINQHHQKHDKLSGIKKAMLEKMFPKQGETIPEIRFNGFSGEWEEREFSSIATRVSTQHQSRCIPCVEYEDIVAGEGRLNKDIFQKAIFKAGLKFEVNDVLFGKLRPYLRNWFLADFNGIAVGDFWVLRAETVAKTFLFYLIQTNRFEYISNLSAGSKMPRSDWGLVSKSSFYVPMDISESQKIGNYFQKLDALINQHQQQVIKLNNIKQACLNKMFV